MYMQKYIAVVNPRMDDDEISQLISKDIAGALFSISHQNYPLALKLIHQVKRLSKQHNRPISIIQDVSNMEDPLDLELGVKSGVHWILTDNHDHMKKARGLNKLIGLINKGNNLPKKFRVDSIMSDIFADPDAQVIGHKSGQIRHLTTKHNKQDILDSISDMGKHAGSSVIAVSDFDLAKALSWRRLKQKVAFAPKDHGLAGKGAIFMGVDPVFMGHDIVSTLKNRGLANTGDRIMDATDVKHVTIHLVP
jgi:hypothetical protein